MDQAEMRFSDLERIAVTTGPGSFTGMRIGIAAARAMGVTLGVPVVGIPTLEVMATFAWQTQHDEDETVRLGDRLIIAVDARKDQVYAQLFDEDQNRLSEAAVLSYEDAAQLVGPDDVKICGSGAQFVAAERRRLGLRATVKFQDLQPSAQSLADYCRWFARTLKTDPPVHFTCGRRMQNRRTANHSRGPHESAAAARFEICESVVGRS